jgi:RNA polymerase sigma factor (sigma-70 family)
MMDCSPEDLALAQKMASIMRHYVPARVESEDILACAYLALVRALPTWDASKHYDRSKWLRYKIRFGIWDELRTEGHMQRASQVHPIFYHPAKLEKEVQADQDKLVLYRELRDAVKRLPPREAKIMRMRGLEGRGQPEVARVFKITEGRISQLEKKAMGRLRLDLAA